jgi:hypothetical protein
MCDFLTDNDIIKSRKSYIVGHLLPSLQGWIFIQPSTDIYPLMFRC